MTDLTDAQKAARTARRIEILGRISGSGEITDQGAEAASSLAKAIEVFEWGDGTAADGSLRRKLTAPLLGSGATKMVDVVSAAQAQLDALSDFN